MGNFSRDTFNKLKHYVGVRLQQGVPIVDADWNELEDIRKYELQAFLKWYVGNGIPQGNDGFRILPAFLFQPLPQPHITFLPNDFIIKGGDGTPEGAGRCLVEGWDVINESNLSYTNQRLFKTQRSGLVCTRYRRNLFDADNRGPGGHQRKPASAQGGAPAIPADSDAGCFHY